MKKTYPLLNQTPSHENILEERRYSFTHY